MNGEFAPDDGSVAAGGATQLMPANFVAVLFRYLWLLMLSGALGGGIAYYYGEQRPLVYEAAAVVPAVEVRAAESRAAAQMVREVVATVAAAAGTWAVGSRAQAAETRARAAREAAPTAGEAAREAEAEVAAAAERAVGVWAAAGPRAGS